MTDTIRQFSKRKGFESIPRELLQSKELSLEAIGLLCNLQSYPSNWTLYKTELRKRFKNKEKVVDKIWDELVSYGYVIQFWKRVGRKYEYAYFFNVEKFNLDEIQELCSEMNDCGMTLYHKAMIKMKREEINYKDYVVLEDSEKENLDLSFWDSQIGNLTEHDETGVSWDSHFGNPNLEFPYSEANRLTNKRLTIKKLDIDKNEEEEFLKRIDENLDFKNLALILRSRGIGLDDIFQIIGYLETVEFSKELIMQQLNWMAKKTEEDGIADFARYFITGYGKRLESRNGSRIEDLDKLLGIDKGKRLDGIMHDWLNGE